MTDKKIKPVTAPDTLAAIEKALKGAKCRPLAATQQAVIAGVLAVYLERARAEGGQAMAGIAKSLRERVGDPGDGILRFRG